VARYLTTTYWLRPDRRGRTIVAFEQGTDDLFGFGVWRHMEVTWPDGSPGRVIRVPWFGVQTEHQGAVDAAGNKCAGVLYSTLEADALQHENSEPDMLVELFCDARNERGLRFWSRRGFIDIGPFEEAPHLRRLIRAPT
jgi:hypothetical protein